MGTAPELTMNAYSPVVSAFTEDTPVKVTEVKIGENDVTDHVTFAHTPCTFDGCVWNEQYAPEKEKAGQAHFIVHVKSFDLTITKSGCDSIDENQSFLFTVDGDGKTLEVVIHGNGSATIKGLKPGVDYTVTENTDWSWRYTLTESSKTVNTKTHQADKGVVTVTFNNTRTEGKWLDGNAYCDNKWIDSSTDKAPTGN